MHEVELRAPGTFKANAIEWVERPMGRRAPIRAARASRSPMRR